MQSRAHRMCTGRMKGSKKRRIHRNSGKTITLDVKASDSMDYVKSIRMCVRKKIVQTHMLRFSAGSCLFNWRPSGEGTPPPFNLCSAYSFRSAKGSMQSEAGDCMRTKSWRLALQGIVPKWYWFAYMLGYRNMCCMSFRFWSTECGEHFCTKWGQMRCKYTEISPRSHAINQTMLHVASEKGL